ncbi:MAG: DUF1883 domain-containing protein [Acidimicrobiia bacterium]
MPASKLDGFTAGGRGTTFLHYQFDASEGDSIVVNLDKQANVRVMDSANFNAYRRGERHRYLGGRALKSPARIGLPHSGRWHVSIDLGAASGRVKASVALERASSRV